MKKQCGQLLLFVGCCLDALQTILFETVTWNSLFNTNKQQSGVVFVAY